MSCSTISAGRPGQTKARSPVTQQHLNLLIMRRQVASWIAAVLILSAPLIASRGELVGSERAAARRKTAGDHNATLPVPALVALQHLGMHGHILQTNMKQLSGCSRKGNDTLRFLPGMPKTCQNDMMSRKLSGYAVIRLVGWQKVVKILFFFKVMLSNIQLGATFRVR